VNAIEAMQAEIWYQVQDLPRQELPSQNRNCLFVGSGDSYVAGLAAQYASGGRALCCYPTDLIQNPSLASGRSVYVVSISGSTKANIFAAKIARKQGSSTTAITARPASLLARSCDRTVELRYKSAEVTTAGTISFTSSMLACTSLAIKLQLPDPAKVYRQAEKQAERIVGNIDRKGSYFILGNDVLHPAAIYGALKFNEVFGAKAVPYQVEEFCHSPLFSVKKSDQIIVMGRDGGRLNGRLVKEGLSSVHAGFKGTGIELLLQSTFFIQLLVLKLAQRRKMTSCYFLKNKKLLRLSSNFIYG
jgi:glutamine---fructose-6-phosphate transaminase (isomerizing)